MNVEQINYLNQNPIEKLNYLKNLLLTNNLTLEQEHKIHHLIQKTELLLQKSKGINLINQGTRNLNNRLSTVQNDIKSVDMLKKNYQQETLKKEAEFEEYLRNKRREFLNEQQNRRNEYENALKLFENEYTNAMQIFKLRENYSVDELKKSYKKMALLYHPDRGGNNKDFQYITKCYILLLEKLNNKNNNKDHTSLKQGYKEQVSKADKVNIDPRDKLYNYFKDSTYDNINTNQQLKPDNKGFNNVLFNKLYEQNRLWNPNDDGYGDWMDNKPMDKDYKPAKIFGDKFCLDIFNSTFDNIGSNNNNTLMKYDEPKQLVAAESQYTLLNGDSEIDDFTKPLDSLGDLKGLSYTDYKKAYENNGANLLCTVGLNKNRKDYKNVKELQKERENISYQMSPEEQMRYEAKISAEHKKERERINRLRQHDYIYQMHYEKTHQNILGFNDPNNDGIKKLQY